MGFKGLWIMFNAHYPRCSSETIAPDQRPQVMMAEVMAALYMVRPTPKNKRDALLNPGPLELKIYGAEETIPTEETTQKEVFNKPRDIAEHVFNRPLENNWGAEHIFFIGDTRHIQVKAKAHTQAKRSASQQKYNPAYEVPITGFIDDFVLGENGVPYAKFELVSARLMSKREHRQILYDYLAEYASRRRWEEHINLFFDFQGRPEVVVSQHPTERASIFPPRNRMYSEADQEIPHRIKQINQKTGKNKFLVWSVDSDLVLITLGQFYNQLVSTGSDHISIVQARGPDSYFSINALALELKRQRISVDLFIAICIVACDTDFTSKSHYTNMIGADLIMSNAGQFATYFGDKFDYRSQHDFEALLHCILYFKLIQSKSAGNLDGHVFTIPKFQGLTNTYSNITEEQNSGKRKKNTPVWLQTAANPDLLYTRRSELEKLRTPRSPYKSSRTDADSKTGPVIPGESSAFKLVVSGDVRFSNENGETEKKICVEAAKTGAYNVIIQGNAANKALINTATSGACNVIIQNKTGQTTLNFEKASPAEDEYDPTAFESFVALNDMILKGIVK